MKMIEERAKAFSKRYGCDKALIDKHHGTIYCPNKIACSKQLPHEIEELYIQIATEEDRIARQEERERCIKAAQDWMCDACSFARVCGYRLGNCTKKSQLRKAMEGGAS